MGLNLRVVSSCFSFPQGPERKRASQPTRCMRAEIEQRRTVQNSLEESQGLSIVAVPVRLLIYPCERFHKLAEQDWPFCPILERKTIAPSDSTCYDAFGLLLGRSQELLFIAFVCCKDPSRSLGATIVFFCPVPSP
jgi:hypothetical protein